MGQTYSNSKKTKKKNVIDLFNDRPQVLPLLLKYLILDTEKISIWTQYGMEDWLALTGSDKPFTILHQPTHFFCVHVIANVGD